ncbi:MAG: cyclopropane-fatty-acyl-phospholipid synthase family protein [Gammaproteobacteria bacterium]|nr:cyclopropane-fatty-acyl-phospholipid synthase family protein [Gammaproteobacteria bacterium]
MQMTSASPGVSRPIDRWLVRTLLRIVGNPPVAFELADGHLEGPATEQPEITLRLHDRAALYELLHRPTRTFGELFTKGRLTVDGDVCNALDVIYSTVLHMERQSGPLRRLVRRMFQQNPRPNTLTRSRENIHTHYDLGNDFYQLWLDREYTQYTCAYYPTHQATLEEAQAAKLELVCRKLALQPGDRVVEAGGGWGGLARYLARNHGVRVRSYNISREQVAYARGRAEREGLGNSIEYVEDDYRNITGSYDVFVSVGMLEHVGLENYRTLGATIDRCLKDDGRGLIHSIGQNVPRPLNAWIESYIFPGAYPPTLRQMMDIFEPVDMQIVDVENLRPHYAQTLKHWRERFEANADNVLDLFDENFVRAWRLYLSGSMSAFRTGQLQLYQVLFQRQGSAALPITRERLFGDG